MRVGRTLYAAQTIATSRRSMVLSLLIREVHVTQAEYTTLQVECIRCGQRQTIRHTEFLLASRDDYVIDLSRMPPCEEKHRLLSHSQNCWERGYIGDAIVTTPDYDYTSVTSIPMGDRDLAQFQEVQYRGGPVEVSYNEFGEQVITRRGQISRNVREALAEAVKEATKPFSKAERRKKQRKKLVEVNCRLIRED